MSEHEWEGKRERERSSPADSLLSMEPTVGLDLKILRSQPKPKPRVGCLTDYTTQVFPIKAIYDKPTANIVLKSDWLKMC